MTWPTPPSGVKTLFGRATAPAIVGYGPSLERLNGAGRAPAPSTPKVAGTSSLYAESVSLTLTGTSETATFDDIPLEGGAGWLYVSVLIDSISFPTFPDATQYPPGANFSTALFRPEGGDPIHTDECNMAVGQFATSPGAGGQASGPVWVPIVRSGPDPLVGTITRSLEVTVATLQGDGAVLVRAQIIN